MIRELIEFMGEVVGSASASTNNGKNEWLVAGIVIAVGVVTVVVLIIVAD
ncbi:MAG: hypothetical protein JNL28_01300 [Planctomycetes bacterium]|nr:hypothetical protein [Planctomycetota bacterium]